jgi:hypothetical protein
MLESAYLSKRLDIRPGNLMGIAQRWHRGLEPMRWSSRTLRAGRGFWLASDASASPVAYEVRGLAWTCGRPVPLVLEFGEWSETQSEVGVCPRSLSWPVGTEQYIRRVTAALESIGQMMCWSTRQVDPAYERATLPAGRSEGIWTSLPVPTHS